jgi:hypothetical protein
VLESDGLSETVRRGLRDAERELLEAAGRHAQAWLADRPGMREPMHGEADLVQCVCHLSNAIVQEL